MGNKSSKQKARLADFERGSTTDEEPRTRWSLSPFRRKGTSEPPIGDRSDVFDVPSRPGKAVVTLTNMQSDKPKGSCITDSIFVGWTPPSTDGGMPIQGYNIEMYDLPTGDWVKVTVTEGARCKSTLDNILCGIMYRFRVRAYNEVGSSVPGIPSDAFVIDTPGIHIAPYFIVCPPAEIVKYAHDTVQFRTKALGTPKPNILWQKDDEPIFVTDGIEVREEEDGSSLTVHNLQLDDHGKIQCIAVNTIGKAEAITSLQVLSRPQFIKDNTEDLQFTFRRDEMIRLKFLFEARPNPTVKVQRNEENATMVGCGAYLRDNFVIFKVDNATGDHSGNYGLCMENHLGKDVITFDLNIETPPDPPGVPEVEMVTEEGELALSWTPPANGPVDHYIVEYFRDQWQLWLRMKTCIGPETLVKDLIPGSRYKFRVMAASTSGVSEPSEESESVMVGKAAEDELFDLPNTRSRPRPRERMNRMKKQTSFERSSLDRENGRLGPISQRRQISLDREVYYDTNNVRRDVVTYIPIENSDKLGTVAKDFGLSNNDVIKYKDSLSNLASKLSSIANLNKSSSKMSLDMATKPLQMEIVNQARKSSSLCHLGKSSIEHIDRAVTNDPFSPVRPERKKKSSSSASLAAKETFLSENNVGNSHQLSNDVNQCRQSLTDIRCRIGSLQSLLQSASKQSGLDNLHPTFADKPRFIIPPFPPYNKPDPNPPLTIFKEKIGGEKEESNAVTRKRSFMSQRNDSYSKAIEDDPVSESTDINFQETHFPYDPDGISEITSIEDSGKPSPSRENTKETHLPTATSSEPFQDSNQFQTTAIIEPMASFFLTDTESQSLPTSPSLNQKLYPNSSSTQTIPPATPDMPRSVSAFSSASSATLVPDDSKSVSDLSIASSITVLASNATSGTVIGSDVSRPGSALSCDTLQGDDMNEEEWEDEQEGNSRSSQESLL